MLETTYSDLVAIHKLLYELGKLYSEHEKAGGVNTAPSLSFLITKDAFA
ncbi:hypothetical protein [Photobacterium minamisatsumaniensis]